MPAVRTPALRRLDVCLDPFVDLRLNLCVDLCVDLRLDLDRDRRLDLRLDRGLLEVFLLSRIYN